ncbi:hypothetical protein AVEN_90908-1 [Araneus ventricosus]|uniref:Uncharacterized protein n=1 Tax=Araneus ventricosus TaxID=182803 RepID=A0A4Y2JLF6_ARAVE|nr:hypothetical protein AVEN_90908-1 [Araneus ventricosus]
MKGYTRERSLGTPAIEEAYGTSDIYLPSQFLIHTKAARRVPMPYRAEYLNHTFISDYSYSMAYESIKPGEETGDPTVNELKWIQYEPSGRIYYKLDLEDQLTELPRRPLTISDVFALPRLYTSRSAILRDKWTDLQSMKKFIPSDKHAFYDSIPCEEESRRQVARKRKNTERVIMEKQEAED